MSKDGRPLFARVVVFWILAAAMGGSLLILEDRAPIGMASANTGCPESTDSFGVYESSGCTISTSTTWGNGTLYMAGGADITVNAPLLLWNLEIYFNQSVDRTGDFYAYDDLTMRASSKISTNPENSGIRWDLWTTVGSDVMDLKESEFVNGIYDFSNAVATIEGNTFRDSDMTDNTQHMWIGANSTLRDNYFDAIDTTQSAVVVVWKNWGETLIWGNDINLTCSGNNCMGIEVIQMQEAEGPTYSGFPVVEIAWNNLTFTSISAGTDSAALDFEYSTRLYAHNNTMDVVHAGQSDTVTEFILSGGARNSVFENNTGYGKPEAGDVYTYCFYQFIYSDSNNTWEYNSCDDVMRMAIISGSGDATWRHNTITNISSTGFWTCLTCGGGSGTVDDHIFYNNTFTYQSGAELAWFETPGTIDNNTLILHGNGQATQWGEGVTGPYHTVPGDGNWLYKAQTSIEGLLFANETDGDRRVTMTANGGNDYWNTYPSFGASDDAALSIEGAINKDGSLNKNDDEEGTFLWELSPLNTAIDLLSNGGTTYINITSFTTNQDYNITIWNYSAAAYENDTFTTDGSGDASFSKSMAANKYNITITPYGEAEWSNTAPSINDPLTTDEAGHNISYSEGFMATDIDTNQTLLWTLATNGSFLSVISSNRSSTVSGTPAFTNRDSTFYVNLTVADQGCGGSCNLTAYTNYTVYVNNSLPYVTNGIASDTGLVGIAYARDFDHQDNNTDTPAWSLVSDAAFLSVHVTTGWVNGTPDATGSFYVNVTVVDYSASGGYANYSLTVGIVGTRGGVGNKRVHIMLFSIAIQGWDTVGVRASAELEESGGEISNGTLTYRWDFGDGSMIQEGPEVTHTYSMGLWARYIVTLQVCTPGDTVCETRSASILLIHWPIVGILAVGSIVATVVLGHRRIRHRVLEVSR